jgi:hypothetical protein
MADTGFHNPTTQLPRQRLPRDEKTEEWEEACIDAICKLSDFRGVPGTARYQMLKAYQYYNGILDEEDYSHVLKPYGEKRENFPAELKNYNIIKPIVDVLIGEKTDRPFNYTVKVNNDDVANKKEEEKKKALKQNLMQQFLFELKEQGVDIGELGPKERPKPPKDVKETVERDYRDTRAIRGQQSLNYMEDDLELERKHQKGWKHWLIAGMVCSIREAGPQEVDYRIINPLNVDFQKSDEVDFIEDAQWASHRKLATVSEVVDEFYEELTAEEIDQLEDPDTGTGNRDLSFIQYDDTGSRARSQEDGRLIEVVECYWKSMKKIGIVTFTGPFGMPREKKVESDYDVGEEESVEWYWISESWRGYRIDDKFYKRIEPVPVQRRSKDNLSECKLPLNGRTYSNMNSPNISLVMLGMAYQQQYNIYKFRLENMIAKAKGTLAQLDVDMIPEQWDMDDFMYYAEATGIMWTQFNKEGNKMNPQHQTVIDMTAEAIQDYVTLLQSVVQEWEKLSGVSRQRQGNIQPQETKSGAENAIVQSSYVTEDYFNRYAHFEERELEALLDYSKWAWINDKALSYTVGNGKDQISKIDGIQHMETEYGVQISDSREDMEMKKQLKDLSQAMLQNDVPLSQVMEILEANSTTGLKEKVEKAEKSRQRLQQQMQKMEQQTKKQEQQLEKQKIDADIRQTQMDNQADIKIQQMKMQQAREQAALEAEMQDKELDVEKELAELDAGDEEASSTPDGQV